jgi:hypothetical protein
MRFLIINTDGIIGHLGAFTEVDAPGPLLAATRVLQDGDTGGIRLEATPGSEKAWLIQQGQENDWNSTAILVEVAS